MSILKTKRNNLEHNIQKSIVRYFKREYPNYIIFSTNNEATFKNQYFLESGVLVGVSDLVIVLPNKVLFVELKSQTGVQSKSQRDFEAKIKSIGHEYYLIRSLTEFQKLIKSNL